MNKTLLWLLAAISPIRADVILGTPPDPANGNGYPFGDATLLGRYQQVYDQNAFPEIITIGTIGFFHTQVLGGSFTGETYTFSLSTTSKSVNGLDLNNGNGNANLGADNAVFSILTLSGAAPVGELLIVGTPFTYDPALGNLLLTIDLSGTANYTGNDLYFDARNSTAAGQFSRAMYGAGGATICCGNDNYGLTTVFTATPEPASGLLCGSVIVAWFGFRIRRLGLAHPPRS